MNGSFKVVFTNDDSFIIYYITENVYHDEEEYKILFKYISDELYKRYNYFLNKFYDVNVYEDKGVYILEFNFVDDYGRKDFNVTLFLNSTLLYQFEDIDFISGNKIYYNGYFYVEITNMLDDIRLFEYGNIIYGKDFDKIFNKGLLIT